MPLAIGNFQWMNGLWSTPLNTPIAGARMIDANGVNLALNQMVKIVGTVVSLDPAAKHFDSVGVMALHPNGGGPNVGEIFFVDPSQLVVGS